SGEMIARGGEHSGKTEARPAPDTGDSSSTCAGTAEEQDPLEDSVFEPQDPEAAVPILEYNREPNKYGKTAGPDISPCPTSYLTCLSAFQGIRLRISFGHWLWCRPTGVGE
ncbi:hypothetical protein XENOCAPTIV_003227, partial [Xenoophorus captivus]